MILGHALAVLVQPPKLFMASALPASAAFWNHSRACRNPGSRPGRSGTATQVVHGVRVTGVGGLLEPLARLAVILGHTQPFMYSLPKLFMASALPASAAFWYHSRALP